MYKFINLLVLILCLRFSAVDVSCVKRSLRLVCKFNSRPTLHGQGLQCKRNFAQIDRPVMSCIGVDWCFLALANKQVGHYLALPLFTTNHNK